LLKVKEEKIQELEKIIQGSAGADMADFLEKSMYLEKFDPKEIHQLQDDKDQLEDQLARQREQLFALKKDSDAAADKYNDLKATTENLKRDYETVLIQNESMKINLKAMEFDKYGQVEVRSPLQKLLDEGDCVS
jgi:RNase adaptor protein for sRNA GlmZ degradation